MSKKSKPAVNDIIDEYAYITMMIAKLSKRRKALIETLLKTADPTKPYLTEKNCVTYESTITTRVDIESIRTTMGSEWIRQFEVESDRQELSVTSLDGTGSIIKKDVELNLSKVQKLLEALLN